MPCVRNGMAGLICWIRNQWNIARPQRKPPRSMTSNADVTRWAADRLFCYTLMRRGLCMCSPQPSRGQLSRCAVFACTYTTLPPGHPKHDHVLHWNVDFRSSSCTVPRLAGNIVASKQRMLRWPNHEIEFLTRSWHESRA